MIDIPIVYEDDSILVINKPAGIIVNRADTVKFDTVQDWAELHLSFPRRRESTEPWGDAFESRAGIAHRIDKETTGILLIGKTPEVFLHLQSQFKERTIKKTYCALVHGSVETPDGTINAPIGRLPWNRERFGIVPGGKEAVTKYTVVKHLNCVDPDGTHEKITLVELHPETGRTHQIRVHMKYINHPLLGDYLYAGRKTSRGDREWATRVMLHAWKLTCIHPVTGNSLDFEAPMPDDMLTIISNSK